MSLSNPNNPPSVNEGAAKLITNLFGGSEAENQTKINQIHGINPVGSTGAGIPKSVTNVTAAVANASAGSTSTVTVRFQRDPSDTSFAGVKIYAKGYQGNNSPVQVGASSDSPATIILNNTGESVSLIVQSVGNGGVSPIASSPTCSLKLPKNPNGGAGTTTITNLTLSQIPVVTVTGSLSVSSAAAPGTVNVTTEGTNDWFITSGVNLSGQQPSQSSFFWKKNGGGFVQNSFVFYYTSSSVEPGASSSSTAGPVAFTATAGDAAYPAGSTGITPPPTALKPYIELSASPTAGGGYGYQFSVFSNSVSRTLRLYMTVQGILNPNQATITAHFMDGSVADQSVIVTDAVTGGVGTPYEVTIVFKSGNPCFMLVTVELTGVNIGAVTFLGATIA